MTVEHRIIAGIDDIKAVVFECVKCQSRVCRSPDRVGDIPYACECGQQWRPQGLPESVGSLEPDFIRFVKAIPTLRMLKREHPLGFKILFEFEEPL